MEVAMYSGHLRKQFLEEHNCRYWGLLKGFHLFIWVKGKTPPKGGKAGKETAMLAGFLAHVRHSLWTSGWGP